MKNTSELNGYIVKIKLKSYSHEDATQLASISQSVLK